MRLSLGCLLLLAGCGGATPETNVADDTGSPIDDDSVSTEDSVAPSFDTGTTSDSGTPPSDAATEGVSASHVKTVFVIVMENHSWSSIKGSSSAPYINSL